MILRDFFIVLERLGLVSASSRMAVLLPVYIKAGRELSKLDAFFKERTR